ncbi:hypothetical protein LBMAG56_02300 [Verrucomicrobiota bacterium]|nr:hypothetical protein LBMAG56_02300 [Verrucomicrobiota bacterium]
MVRAKAGEVGWDQMGEIEPRINTDETGTAMSVAERAVFGVRGLVTALSRRLVAVEQREARIWNGAFTARASGGAPARREPVGKFDGDKSPAQKR